MLHIFAKNAGEYMFDKLPAGDYSVRIVNPERRRVRLRRYVADGGGGAEADGDGVVRGHSAAHGGDRGRGDAQA